MLVYMTSREELGIHSEARLRAPDSPLEIFTPTSPTTLSLAYQPGPAMYSARL